MSLRTTNASLIAVTLLAAFLSGCVNAPAKKVDPVAKGPQPLSPEARADFDEAMKQMKAEQYQQGIVLLERVVSKSQNNAVPYINLAIAYGKLGNYKSAEDDLKKALAMDPDNPVANNEYALLYRKTGRFAEARQQYEKVLQKYPNYPMAHKNLGILCDIYLRDYACALKNYEAYGVETPADKSAKIWVADVQKRMESK